MNRKSLLGAVCFSLGLVCALLALLPAGAGATVGGQTSGAPVVNSPLVATTFITVNFPGLDAADYNLGDGRCDAIHDNVLPLDQCTLRAAIQNANATAGPVTIIVPAATYNLVITGTNEDAAATGDLDITKDVTILGAGAGSTVIQWSATVTNTSRDNVFHIIGGTVTISGMTIQGAYAVTGIGGGIRINAATELNLADSVVTGNYPHGILSDGQLFLTGSTISSNSGTGISSQGTLTVTDSTINGNGWGIDTGGSAFLANSIIRENAIGVINRPTGALIISNTLVTGNGNSCCFGGGIWNQGTLVVTTSTLAGNATGGGAGFLQFDGSATMVNTTVSGNTAVGAGGGIYLGGGALNLNNVTIANNTADSDGDNNGDGGGIFVNGGTLNVKNSTIAGNHDNSPTTKKADCAGNINSQGYNLIQDTTGCTISGTTTGNLLGVDPKLAPLQNNGGATFTHALLPGSPAIDAGSPGAPGSGGNACAATDQRGISRLMDGDNDGTPRCDIGAYEIRVLRVNSPNDAVDAAIGDGLCASGSGECTLRAAIQECNFWPGEDLIFVPLGTYDLKKFGANEVNGATGDLNVNDSVVIAGAGANNTIIQGTSGWDDRILRVSGAISVEISGVTLRRGNAGPNDGGAILIDAASPAARLTLKDSLVTSNTGSYGGGIFSDNGTLVLSNTVVSRNTSTAGGGVYLQAGSAALLNSALTSNTANWGAGLGGLDIASLLVRSSVIGGNVASAGDGGGMAILKTMSDSILVAVDYSSFEANFASHSGGGMFAQAALTLTNSTVGDNRALLDGGGLFVNNTLRTTRISNSTLSGNSATSGGGIYDNSAGEMDLVNSTVSGNRASQDGGGLYIFTSVSLNNATISNNTADSDADGTGNGGGVFVLGGTLNFKNTLIAGNADNSPVTKHPDCYGGLASQGYNLVGSRDPAGCSFVPLNDQVGTLASPIDPKLGPLQNNGGATLTHALLPGSPAIDAGNPGGCTDANGGLLTSDQRGYLRPLDGNNDGMARCDIGAFEFALLRVFLPMVVR